MTITSPNISAVEPLTPVMQRDAMTAACAQLKHSLPMFTFAAQNHSSVNNVYPAVANDQWTSGFWPGSLWLAFEATDDKTFQYAAQVQVQALLHRIENRIATDHHDMGFMYSPSCVAAWKLAGDADGRRAALLAADQMLERFQEKGAFFQAWGDMGAPDNYRFIIDCLLNLPLMFWATKETENPVYAELARRHMQTSLTHSIRDDHSTFHTMFMDRETGEAVRGATQQGYSDTSSWARGQAWAITGVAFLYRLDPTPELKTTFDNLLTYYMERLPSDLVPYWDLIFTDGEEPRDSSAAAIVCCGLLEMATCVPADQAAPLRDLAERMLGSLARHYAVRDPAVSNGLLLHGTYSKKTPYNGCRGEGVDECVSWGDYFYMEALTRLSGDWSPYW
ncbi:glycoside hydrolase family 88 protein [Litoreibacter albidus]|uniref:Unsaturated chondroitin disaccharide hydrolase n=1 Tax=Litoreibacter albidus TaxID=670155 RepID=A0A1H3CJA7_9RHOB|nr:glycoside hydrolase family 88 protein [Litoreibacter albidus]SDX54207.1 unsaturated chondroitin disaccharide hydrolase [Litoreibacter albidus]